MMMLWKDPVVLTKVQEIVAVNGEHQSSMLFTHAGLQKRNFGTEAVD